jgi:spermidine/putrescine-binding protein
MKRVYQLILITLLAIVSFNLASCDKSNDLYILNWDEYIDEDLISEFEELYDRNVILDIAQSNETMFSKIMSDAAPYDIAFPSDYMIGQMIECDEDGVSAPIIKKIDFAKLENYNEENFDPKLRALIDKDCKILKDYSVPYFWGSLGIMYNTEALSDEQIATIKTKGWNVLFEKELLGDVKIGMYASARDSIASALLYNGYSLNSKNSSELQKAGDSLYNMNYHAWATDDLKTGVASGKYDLALVYSGDFFDTLYSVEEDVTFDMIAPDNNNVFFDAMVIPQNSMNEELAYKFIDFMISYDNALRNAQYVGYCPTQTAVFQAMYEDEEYDGVATLDVYYPGNISNGEIYKYLGTQTYELYDLIYKKVKK